MYYLSVRGILLVLLLLFLTGCGVLLGETKESYDPDELIREFAASMHTYDYYQILVKNEHGENNEQYYIEYAPSNLLRITQYSDPKRMTIYADDDTFVRRTDTTTWYKLNFAKINPAFRYMNYDIREMVALTTKQLDDFTYQGEKKCAQSDCAVYQLSELPGQNITILIHPNTYRLMEITISDTGDETMILQYTYDEEVISIPQEYEEITISENPTRAELEVIEEIYGE